MRFRRARKNELRPGDRVKWRDQWWAVERIDGRFTRVARRGVSQYVYSGVLRVRVS